ncbi:MAG: thioredoxin TrxC [Rhodobacteraceae bacterium]|nr:thioredoxin TrxC [Paracoccaceae bacterium]MCB1368887.1 thioredoxin TrxC [Paracoccaceae bacterium]
MPEAKKLTCLECGGVNRVPVAKLTAGPKCGVCGAKLADGKVRELDPQTLAKATANDEVPLVVDFWAPWCGPCRMMAPEFARASQAMSPNVRFAKINTEDFPQVSQKFGIRGIPLLIVFHKGREIARQAGANPASVIESYVRAKTGVNV